MSALREAVLLQMRLRGFAQKTVDAYIHAMEQLWEFFKRPLERLTCGEVQRFLDEVITVRKLAWATVNVYFSAYRFLYYQALPTPALYGCAGAIRAPEARTPARTLFPSSHRRRPTRSPFCRALPHRPRRPP